MPKDLLLGLERVPITPPMGIQQIGYYGRDHGAEYILDDLYATALVFAQADTKLALVSCDLLFLHPSMVEQVRRLVAEETGIPASRIMICCTHTHSGPITYATEQQTARDRAYLANLVYQITGAISAANRQLQPARLSVGHAQGNIGVNRREQRSDGRVILGVNLEGPVDSEVLVLRLDSEDGNPLAVVVNHACHAVALGAENYGISADWPGAMRAEVEAVTEATCVFIQGACADINPVKSPQRDYGWARRLGQGIAGAVIQAWAAAQEIKDGPLNAHQELLSLPLLGPAIDGETPAARLAEEKLGLPWELALPLLDRRFPWAASVVSRVGRWWVPAEVQAFRMGDVGWVAVPVEPFVEVGLAVKGRSPLVATFVAGYSNGCVGYLPTPAAYEIGGYEVDTSYLYYHLPAPLAPECAGMVTETAVRLLEQLSQ